jgi:hypothetical protein
VAKSIQNAQWRGFAAFKGVLARGSLAESRHEELIDAWNKHFGN